MKPHTRRRPRMGTRTCHVSEFPSTGFHLYTLHPAQARRTIYARYDTPVPVAKLLDDHAPFHRTQATVVDTKTGRRVHPYEIAPPAVSVVLSKDTATTTVIAITHPGGIFPLCLANPVSYKSIYDAVEKWTAHPIGDNTIGATRTSYHDTSPINRHSSIPYNGQILHYTPSDQYGQISIHQPGPDTPSLYPSSHIDILTQQADECAAPRKKTGSIVFHIERGVSVAVAPNTIIGPLKIVSSSGVLADGSVCTNSTKPHNYVSCSYAFTAANT